MTTDITELAQRMKAAAEKATPGEWWADEVKNEGCYGSGDDCVEGFTSYAIYGSDGQTLFDSLNSDAACISEEYDGEGHVAWDETAQRNAEFIALANPANILALVEALEKARAGEKQWRELVDAFCSDDADWHKLTNSNNELIALLSQVLCKQADRIAELENQLKSAENNEIDARCHIAELESSTVKLPKLKMLEDYLAEVAIEERKQILVGVKLEFHRALAAAGIKVEVE
ncbi:RelE family toxin-antitoxin system [Klebsiella pneumoniae subsp. pneumoniae]|uniref:RelE family toxin-antitoxin system n=1 Tax=Klebsiella pneumoniae subsp. pneumoniae TaxID=72407 RepID=A0A377ZYN8_KLEPN|nr:ead/Ea22-like family protein [Klebsiella pneumoniae]STU90634.1 RelE family toxin-antitoxin system [Klebsiella pneumoniae subsp. pneumoniae]STW53400.1 RelE family toxin-antitoxin system [Klebsiella pneumoniae]SYU52430.1 RelE family toxin-antitoxin system [Klebsiella pneumoniae]